MEGRTGLQEPKRNISKVPAGNFRCIPAPRCEYLLSHWGMMVGLEGVSLTDSGRGLGIKGLRASLERVSASTEVRYL